MVSPQLWVESVVIVYFLYVAFYNIVLAIAGRYYTPVSTNKVTHNKRFAVFIPGYKEDNIIISTAKQAVRQDYDAYDVIIIADSFQESTLKKLSELPVKIIPVSFEKSTKVKALNVALSKCSGNYDYAVILDADNHMEPGFLHRLNQLHQLGFDAIQGKRAAKNNSTTMAYLDGLSEEINNHLICKGSTALGLSSALKGSGMSFKYDLLAEYLGQMSSVGGFDRELELRLVEGGKKVYYAEDVVVLDEKVENRKVFENQRKRWISSQYYYLAKYFKSGMIALFTGRFALFNSTVLRNIQLPRLLNLGLLVIFSAISGILFLFTTTLFSLWIILVAITFLSVILAIPKEYLGKKMIKAIFTLPMVFIKMALIMFKLKGANEKFIHTPHSASHTGDNKS